MPYIKQEERHELDFFVNWLGKFIKYDGDLNYILFKLARSVEPSYSNYKKILGEIHEAEMEIRRRFLVPYEYLKMQENGDV